MWVHYSLPLFKYIPKQIHANSQQRILLPDTNSAQFDDHDTFFILLILLFKGKSKDSISSQTACSGRKNVESCRTIVFAWRMDTPHCDCCAAPAQLSCHAWMYFFKQAPATSDQQITSTCTTHQTSRRLHMSQVLQALPTTGFSLLWTS